MDLIKKLFSRTQEDPLKKEYESLMIKANEYERELCELIQQKVKMQLALNSFQKQQQQQQHQHQHQLQFNSSCFKCERVTEEVNEIIKEKAIMLNEFKEIKDKIQQYMNSASIIDNTPLPQFEAYFVMNSKYYVLDKDSNMYVITLCNKYQEYKNKNKDDQQEKTLMYYINNVYDNKND